MKKAKNKKKIDLIAGTIGFLFLLGGIGVSYYLNTYYSVVDVADYLVSSDTVEVTQNKNYIFFDNNLNSETSIIFYPGAKVDALAYSPICRGLADKGYDVFIMKMPKHMAIFDTDAANLIYKKYNYTNHYLAGHSMGGAACGVYIPKTSNKVNGAIFLAAYSNKNLTNVEGLKTLSIYGDKDGVLKLDKYNKYKTNLPNLTEVVIEGGNHAQFGSYGKQKGDYDASITLEEQTSITINAVYNFINNA